MNNYYITSGSGTSDNPNHKLVAFDNALIQAGISNYNLVRVSSILPASAIRQTAMNLPLASPLHTAYATVSSNILGEQIATAIAVGIPKNKSDIGVIMEAIGTTAEETAEIARSMVIEAMKNHGIEIDHIEFSSIEGTVSTGYLSLVSAIAMW